MSAFSNALQSVLKEEDDKNYILWNRQYHIKELILNEVMEGDADFKNALTGTLYDTYNWRVIHGKNDVYMVLKFPFALKPIKDSRRPGFVFLHAGGFTNHFALVNGYVDRLILQNWLRKVFAAHSEFRISYEDEGVAYDVEYIQQDNSSTNTFLAKSGDTELSFNFLPVFKFDNNQWPLSPPPHSVPRDELRSCPWYAVPQYNAPDDQRPFMVRAPDWENSTLWSNMLILMVTLRSAHKNDLPHLTNYMLKIAIVTEVSVMRDNSQSDLGVLVEMWDKITQHYQSKHFPHLLASDLNLFDGMTSDELEKGRRTAEHLGERLRSLRRTENCLSEVRALFNMN